MRARVKAVSTVIAAIIVLTVFIGLASAIYTGLFQLSNESSNLVKREAERAMEAFFQIYWINETYVVLFNNHTSVPVTLLYWVTTDPVTGQYKVFNLNPAKYTVPPGTMRIVDNFDKRGNLFPINRVVSDKGTSFEVTDAPTEITSGIYFTPTERIVRPGFNGRLTTFVISTGPDFGGGDVTITCITIINTVTGATIPCSSWGISFAPPSGTITVPAGSVRALGVNASIPTTFTQYGFYVVKLRLQSASFTREYSVRVIVTNFSATVTPNTITLTACMGSANLVLTHVPPPTYTGHIKLDVSAPGLLVVWADPNPAAPRPHPLTATTTVGRIIVERLATPPTGILTSTLTVTLIDDLGTPITATFFVRHEVSIITVVTRILPPGSTTLLICP